MGYPLVNSYRERRNLPSLQVLYRTEQEYTQGPKYDPYMSRQITRLDAWTPAQKDSMVELVRDVYGKLTERREYGFDSLTTPVPTFVSAP